MGKNLMFWGAGSLVLSSVMSLSMVVTTVLDEISHPEQMIYGKWCALAFCITLVSFVVGLIIMVTATRPPGPKTIQEATEVQQKYRLDLLMKGYGKTRLETLENGRSIITILVEDRATAEAFRNLLRGEVEGVPIVLVVREIPVVSIMEEESDPNSDEKKI
ncbi:MAG: hypothetical protein HY225_00830 [Candidatus Vogelbacteria bacterium]|nr:hypothetical protein [Candidatus Vogelbacteria bacterium]